MGEILRKTEVSFVSCHVLYCSNAQLGPTEIFVSLIPILKFLPACASKQGNVIRLVSVYICTYVRSCHKKKIVIERSRDLIYLKFVVTDFFLKIISPSAGENSGDLA